MKRMLSLMLAVWLVLPIVCCDASAEEGRPVLTIGDFNDRSSFYQEGENQLGLLRYLEELLGVDIQYVHMYSSEYASALSSGQLPDIVATKNNLSTILESEL